MGYGWILKKAATYQRKTKAARFETVPSEIGAPENQGNRPSVGNGRFQEIFA